MSRKTVEAHLTRAYRKLGVRSRTELTRLLLAYDRLISAPTEKRSGRRGLWAREAPTWDKLSRFRDLIRSCRCSIGPARSLG